MAAKQKIIFGVCNWVANKFGLDVSIVRIAFVLFTIFGGAGLLLYFILWIVKILGEE